MRRLFPFALLAAALAAPAGAAPIKMTPAVQKDVQCFLLFAVASDQAKDDKSKQGTALALTYFMGKLAVSAPTLNLAAAIQQEGEGFKDNIHAKEVGDACDVEFSRVGTQLQSMGSELQKPEPAPTPAPRKK